MARTHTWSATKPSKRSRIRARIPHSHGCGSANHYSGNKESTEHQSYTSTEREIDGLLITAVLLLRLVRFSAGPPHQAFFLRFGLDELEDFRLPQKVPQKTRSRSHDASRTSSPSWRFPSLKKDRLRGPPGLPAIRRLLLRLLIRTLCVLHLFLLLFLWRLMIPIELLHSRLFPKRFRTFDEPFSWPKNCYTSGSQAFHLTKAARSKDTPWGHPS